MDTATHSLTSNARPADPWPLASIAPPQTFTFKATPAPAPRPLLSRLERVLVALALTISTASIGVGTVLLESALKAH